MNLGVNICLQHDDCRFFHNVRRYSTHSSLHSHGVPSVWDLEDLTKFGRERTSCPYFMARELMLNSDIIFCPYNYLLDPMIRQSVSYFERNLSRNNLDSNWSREFLQMDISLKGHILILDEAHNIEDTCRDSASISILQDSILDAIHNCEEIAAMVSCEGLYRDLVGMQIILEKMNKSLIQRKHFVFILCFGHSKISYHNKMTNLPVILRLVFNFCDLSVVASGGKVLEKLIHVSEAWFLHVGSQLLVFNIME